MRIVDYLEFSNEMREELEQFSSVYGELYEIGEKIQSLIDKEHSGDKAQFIEMISHCMDYYTLRHSLGFVLQQTEFIKRV